jgi:hypothetical protein
VEALQRQFPGRLRGDVLLYPAARAAKRGSARASPRSTGGRRDCTGPIAPESRRPPKPIAPIVA